MLVHIKENYEELSATGAQIVAQLVRRKPDCVLGFATGGTPLGMYKELIRLHQYEGLDFSKVTTFNLDEYVGLPPEHDQSYHYFMWENLFKHINVDRRYVHLPMGMAQDVAAHCEWYEERIKKAGGIDLQILGIGANGHIAFNEPGSSLGSRTRIKTLTGTTREANARFFKTPDEVPKFAITMGVGTIMDAKQLLLLASGEGKANAIAATCEGALTAACPASIVQLHRYAFVIVDQAAASKLRMTYTD
ncbi:MAG: Glucosamine-6-phosphate deaminase 1 [bacterium]|nr:Glucosamine-6-phosphate deaminase 1 [bacterium]MCK6558427.1 glucosamine-6-phosphate deaminase [bacterium]NUM68300.1 glucosamine-6-phosphate deaminase [candidate division KSB1 bacterium]